MRVLNGFIGFVSKGSIPNRVCVEKWDNGLGGAFRLSYLGSHEGATGLYSSYSRVSIPCLELTPKRRNTQ